MDQFIVYNNIETFDAAAPPAGEKVSFPPPNDMWRANIISSARRRSPAGSTSNAVWFAAMFQKTTKFTIFSQSITVFLSPSFSIFKKISS